MRVLDVATLAYCAGIIDGEGYVGCSRKSPRGTSISYRFVVRVFVTMADREPVEMVARLVGAPVSVRDRKAKPTHSAMFQMEVQSHRAVQLLKLLMPYLVCKKRQAELAIELYDLKAKSGQFRTKIGPKNATRVLSDDYISQCDELYLAMRRRGVTNNGHVARPL